MYFSLLQLLLHLLHAFLSIFEFLYSYQSAKSASFRTLETDGCSTRDWNGVRESSWETYSSFENRLRKLDATDPTLNTIRECEAKQKIIISGSGFGHGKYSKRTLFRKM